MTKLAAHAPEFSYLIIVADERDIVAVRDPGNFPWSRRVAEGIENPGALVGEGEREGVSNEIPLTEHAIAAIGAIGLAAENIGPSAAVIDSHLGGTRACGKRNRLDGNIVTIRPRGHRRAPTAHRAIGVHQFERRTGGSFQRKSTELERNLARQAGGSRSDGTRPHFPFH